jgi:predicted TIM-barrel fold metal-dependent hydrolase
MPQMLLIDTHMHLNGTLADPARYPALKDQPKVEEMSCFGWFGRGDRPDADASVEALIQRMASARPRCVDRAVNVTPGWCGWDNSYTMDALRGNESWLAAVVLCDPLSELGALELKRLTGEGACGLRIQPPCTGPLTDPRQTLIWEMANSLGVTVQVNLPQRLLDDSQCHAQPSGLNFNEPGWAQIEQRARQFPDTKIVVDHCGWMSGATGMTDVETLLPLARQPNIYAKCTFGAPMGTMPWEDASPLIRQVIDSFGSNRCVSGSNFCGEPQETYSSSMEVMVNKFPYVSEEERLNICGRTALSLWRWKESERL